MELVSSWEIQHHAEMFLVAITADEFGSAFKVHHARDTIGLPHLPYELGGSLPWQEADFHALDIDGTGVSVVGVVGLCDDERLMFIVIFHVRRITDLAQRWLVMRFANHMEIESSCSSDRASKWRQLNW